MRKLVIAAVAVAIVAAGCGDRGTDASKSGTGATTTAAAEAAPAAGDWGTLSKVCGPKEGGGKVAASAGKDAQGISAAAIKVGTVADPGFSGRLGLNQEIFDAGTAFVAWCNAAGGINGKELELSLRDAKLTEYEPVVKEACAEDFALVGDGAVQDNLWPTVGVPCGLIDVAGFAVTAQKAGLLGDTPAENRQVQPVPNAGDTQAVGGAMLLDDAFPGVGDRQAFLYADFQTLIDQRDKELEAYEEIGHTIVHQAAYGLGGESNWKPFAAGIEKAEVRELSFIGEPGNGAALELAMQQTGYTPEVRYYEPNFYDKAFVDAAGDAADGAFVSTVFIPLEEAATHPATKLYVDNVTEAGGKVAVLGLQSTSGWLLFATLAKACDLDDDLTRSCILKRAAAVRDWTGGGLHAPTDPGTNTPTDCTVLLQIVDGKFTRFAPKKTDYACKPEYLVQVKPGT